MLFAVCFAALAGCAACLRADAACATAVVRTNSPGEPPWAAPGLSVPKGFSINTIARVPQARELAALPNGDLLVGTSSRDVYLVPNAEGRTPAAPSVFVTAPDDRASGVTFSARRCEIYVATERAVYVAKYATGQRTGATLRRIFEVRTGPIAPHSDGDVHSTTSVAYSGATDTLYVAVGSSCNACAEVDPTRASIFRLSPPNGRAVKVATRIRNAIALTIDPQSGGLWAGDAGQDDLPFGHPYEFLDDVSSHTGVADYGWPQCEEHRTAYAPGADCSKTVAPLVVLPAYSTIVGAAFYPLQPRGPFAFPPRYRGALFAAAHGSWHTTPNGTSYAAVPQVVTVAMRDGRPVIPVDWQNPRAQWLTFLAGFQAGARDRIGRPTGIAAGPLGSLFVADDSAGAVYRIRPR
jgi:glucose/arabinose dehydrogenase